MARGKPIPRAELRLLVKHLIENSGDRGITSQELLAAIGPDRTSSRSIQRAIDDLRTIDGADLVATGKIRRWRFLSTLHLLEAPTPKALRALLRLHAHSRPLLADDENEAITTMLEEFDARARNHAPAAELPMPNVLTSSFTHATQTDPTIFTRLLLACRRKTMRMLYASPWLDTPVAAWHDIEPWAIHIHDTTHYLRVWSITLNEPRTFNLAHIQALEDVTGAPPRRPVPKKPWPTGSAFGIDSDHPGIAVVRLRGPVARWQKTETWHPAQSDDWREDKQLLERTLPIHSRREFTRFLGTFADAIVAIGPPELALAFIAHCTPSRRIQKLPGRL